MADLKKAKDAINAAIERLKQSGPEGLHVDAANAAIDDLQTAADALEEPEPTPAEGETPPEPPDAEKVKAIIVTLEGAVEAIDALAPEPPPF